MKWTDIPSGQTNGAFQRFMVALGDDADIAVNRINTEPVFADRMAAYARNGGIEASTSHQEARAIMGRNFFGLEEAMKHFGVNPSKRQMAYLAEVPFTKEVLTACKDTHVLVAVFQISLVAIRAKAAQAKVPNVTCLFYQQDWYDSQAFANENGQVEWHLVRKTPVADSLGKNWSNQQALLSKEEETDTAQVMVYTIIGHFLATCERLFEKVWVRTSSFGSGGRRVYVGFFGAGGLRVSRGWDDGARDNLGLASSRKSEP